MIYAGVGSRLTPPPILTLISQISMQGHREEHILRTGDASGADKAFRDHTSRRVIYGANDFQFGSKHMSYEAAGAHWDLADALLRRIMDPSHYAAVTRSDYVHRLHMRNTFQVLGINHRSPVSMVICWTHDGKPEGGTRTAIRTAELNGIPVYNLGLPGVEALARYAIEQGQFPFLEG